MASPPGSDDAFEGAAWRASFDEELGPWMMANSSSPTFNSPLDLEHLAQQPLSPYFREFSPISCPVSHLLNPADSGILDSTPVSALIQQLEHDAAADLVASLFRQSAPPPPTRQHNTTTTAKTPELSTTPALSPLASPAGAAGGGAPVSGAPSSGGATWSILENGEFLLNKKLKEALPRDPSVSELQGRVLGLARVQYGSRLLQRVLARSSPSHVDLILKETLDELPALMTDAYGNYLCQQLFEVCTPDQRRQILTRLGPCAAHIAEDRRGTHSMQALIGLVADEAEELLLLEDMLRSANILALSTHPHATHVIQRALTTCGLTVKTMIFEPIIARLSEVARTPHGICVVKKCISASASDEGCEGFRGPLLKKLGCAAIPLIQSPYGNYAIQHALDAYGAELCKPILRQVWDNFLLLSTQKFSSNVVEKSIAVSSDSEVQRLLRLATQPSILRALLASSYGTFVIQKLLTRVDDEEAERVLTVLVNAHVELSNKRLRAKFDRLLYTLADRLKYSSEKPVTANSSAATTATNCR